MSEISGINLVDAFIVLYEPGMLIKAIVGMGWDRTTYSTWHLSLEEYNVDGFKINFLYNGSEGDLLFSNGQLVMDVTIRGVGLGKDTNGEKPCFYRFNRNKPGLDISKWEIIDGPEVTFRVIEKPNLELNASLDELIRFCCAK